MALLKRGQMLLIGILVVLGLLVTSCETTNTPPETQEPAGDTLGLDGGVTTLGIPLPSDTSLGSRPAGATGIGTQQEEESKTGTLVPREPVEAVFRDLPELAEAIDIEQVLSWSQVIGFTDTVIVTAPEGTELPRVITYNEAEFTATIRDEGLDRELQLEIGSDDEDPIVLELQEQEQEGNTYTYTFREDSRDLTTIRIGTEDAQELFVILTLGSDENSIEFKVELNYEIDGNSSIPEEAEFAFEFVTETGFFEIERDGGEEDGGGEEDIR